MNLTRMLSCGAAATLLLSGCAAAQIQGEDSERIKIVTSTNVYSDIAAAIGADLVDVHPIITSTSQDPHSYEATAQDRLLISQADLVIHNGGGYDSFMEVMLEANNAGIAGINAVEVSGLAPVKGEEHGYESDGVGEDPDDDHGHEGHGHDDHNHAHIPGFNEHIWYHLGAMEELSNEIAAQLVSIDPTNADAYQQRLTGFVANLSALGERTQALAANDTHHHVAITETVPLHLLEATGAHNVTPPEFSQAIEEGFDVAPAVVQDMLNLMSSGEVSLLAYNLQTASSETERIRQRAQETQIAVVEFTETIPEGHSYLTWMDANIASLETALAAKG